MLQRNFYMLLLVLSGLSLYGQGEKFVNFGSYRPNCNNPIYIYLCENRREIDLDEKVYLLDSIASEAIVENDYPKYLFFKTELARFYIRAFQNNAAIDILESSRKVFTSHYDSLHIEYVNSLKEQQRIKIYNSNARLALLHRMNEIVTLMDLDYDKNPDNPFIYTIRALCETYFNAKEYEKSEYYQNIVREEYKRIDYFAGIILLNETTFSRLKKYSDLDEATHVLMTLTNKKIEPFIEPHFMRSDKVSFIASGIKIADYYYTNAEYDKAIAYYTKLLEPQFNHLAYKPYYYLNLTKCYTKINDTIKANENADRCMEAVESGGVGRANKIIYYENIAQYVCLTNPQLSHSLVDSLLTWTKATENYVKSTYTNFNILFEQKRYQKAIDYSKSVLKMDSITNTLQIKNLDFQIEGKIYWSGSLAISYYHLWKQTRKANFFMQYEQYALELITLYRKTIKTNINSFEGDKEIQLFYNSFLDSYLLKTFVETNLHMSIDESLIIEAISLSKSQIVSNAQQRLKGLGAVESVPFIADYMANLNSIQRQKDYLKTKADSLVSQADLIHFSDLLFQNVTYRTRIDKYLDNNFSDSLPQYKNLALQKVQETLGEKKGLMEFFVGDSLTYVYLITDKGFKISVLNTNQLKELSSKLLRNIKTGNGDASNKLGELLFSDFHFSLNDKSELVIIPDKWLSSIPFEAITYANTDKKLISKFNISYHYSVQSWSEGVYHKSQHTNYSLLAIAPVFDDSYIPELENVDSNLIADAYRGSMELSPLPNSYKEVKQIQKKFKKQKLDNYSLTQNNATEQQLNANYANYSIIHFATHGLTNKKYFERSGIYLYPNQNSDLDSSAYDNFLSLGEIYALENQPDLVVLSACKTGTGKIVEGEGVMALPRGFIYAGVPNVIASLWKVHDEKTKDLMVAFYTHLLEDKVSYAEALRLAKLDCIKKGFLPMDWASFVLIGN